jgi:hypothetical protein
LKTKIYSSSLKNNLAYVPTKTTTFNAGVVVNSEAVGLAPVLFIKLSLGFLGLAKIYPEASFNIMSLPLGIKIALRDKIVPKW